MKIECKLSERKYHLRSGRPGAPDMYVGVAPAAYVVARAVVASEAALEEPN